jgi:Methyltransferase domain
MLPTSRERIESMLGADELVLDVGGWASPWPRADWVIDLMPYETRGLYGPADPASERFGPDTWVERDICDHEPWPFEDDQFDFAVCAHTLEDIRDPVFVCAELNRVARAGYVEVPSRLEEQSWGVVGPYVGWSHHRWLVDVRDGALEFVAKPHVIHANPEFHFPAGTAAALTPAERVEALFWEGGFGHRERIFLEAEELDRYLAEPVAREGALLAGRLPRPGLAARVRARLGALARN